MIDGFRSIEDYNNFIYDSDDLNLNRDQFIKGRIKPDSEYGFIHIGKCGGTEVLRHLNSKIIKEIHWEENPKLWHNYTETKWILWIRNPFARFVSAFWYSWNGVHLPCRNDDCPHKPIQEFEAKGIPTHTDTQKLGFNIFNSPNELAEALSSDNVKTRELAIYMMRHGGEHLPNSLATYLDNGNWLDNNKNIVFVGHCENMDDDILKLKQKLGDKLIKIKQVMHSRRGVKSDKYLSNKAIKNLKNLWKNTELKTIYKLYTNNFISFETFMKYNTYEYIL